MSNCNVRSNRWYFIFAFTFFKKEKFCIFWNWPKKNDQSIFFESSKMVKKEHKSIKILKKYSFDCFFSQLPNLTTRVGYKEQFQKIAKKVEKFLNCIYILWNNNAAF